MNWDRIEGNWKQWSGKAKEKWGELGEGGGRRDQLLGKTREVYGRAKADPLFPVVLLGLVAVIGIVAGALMTPRQTRVSRHHWKR